MILLFGLLGYFSIPEGQFSLNPFSGEGFNALGIRNNFRVISQLGILALGAGLLIIAGEFDLSIGSMVGFAGAVIAARRNKLLSLTTEPLFETESKINWFNFIGKVTTIFIVLVLAYGSWELVKIEMDYPVDIAPLLPRWAAQIVMPVGFLLIAIHLLINGYASWKNRIILLFGITSIFLLTHYFDPLQESMFFMWIVIFCIFFSLIKGAPIFIGLGGMAILFFWRDWTPLSAISAETYRIVVSPTLPTIPLFTLAGYILAESKASERLVKLFRSLFGWIPGGTPVVLVLLLSLIHI